MWYGGLPAEKIAENPLKRFGVILCYGGVALRRRIIVESHKWLLVRPLAEAVESPFPSIGVDQVWKALQLLPLLPVVTSFQLRSIGPVAGRL